MILFKIKAGALQFSIFVTVIIAIILASFIILIHTHKRFIVQTKFVVETIDNTNKGIDYVLNHNINLNETHNINLQDEDYKTLNAERNHWGVFEKISITSKIKTNTFTKTALIGASQPKKNRLALYLEDQNKPLVVVGNTKIQGLAYLPKQGIRTGNISGHSYYGNRLIYGPTRISNSLPKIQNEITKQIKTINKDINNIRPNLFLDINKTKSHQNSFLNPLKVIYSLNDINLSGVSLIGHIIIQSKTKIVVESSSNLKDVILIAPTVEIKDRVKGVFQIISRKKITIGKHCSLNYPSAIVLIENKLSTASSKKNEDNQIIINKSSNIKGAIVFLGNTKLRNYNPQVIINENSKIEGEIYCNQNLELKGDVNGSVYTSNFLAKQSGSVYQNHIYNGTISTDKLAQEYVGLLFKDSKKSIIKWLY